MDGSQGEGALGSQGSRAGDEDPALKGISFAAMSAPGPSGARHEHLRSFLRIKRKCVVNRLLRVLETFLKRALGGDCQVGHTGFCTLNSLSSARMGLTPHALSVLGIIFVVSFGSVCS